MSARSLLDEAHATRLLAKKSSYQAWKCVSFGCSLLALLLLLAKWQEISSDLQLLANIEQLLWSQQQQQQQQSQQLAAEGFNGTGSGEPTWPPASMSTPTISEFGGSTSNESVSSTNSSSQQQLVVSHMQVSVSRELQAKELLKKELDTFIAEFRSAKSTISLSSLLVGVYLISWILMTLAINDARISNDISVRNILLLSVFGAIDVAASLGFVLIRLIMYSVKNNSFRGEMLASAGLRDTPIRLAPDQLTAFAALRLIGMRSCSAYMDVYVSLIVILLTVLRLYAILQALAYYRHLRRSSAGGPFGGGGGQEMPGRALWSASGRDTPLSEGPKHVWSIMQPQQQHWPSYGGANVGRTNSLASSQQAMISGRASPQQPISQHPRYSFQQQQQQQQHHQLPPKSAGASELDRRTLSARPKAVWQPPRQVQQQRRPPELLLIPSNTSSRSQQARKSTASERPIRNESRSPSPVAARRQQQQAGSKPRVATNTLRGSDGTTYTLLSANQLERISRKLLESTQDTNNNNNNGNGSSGGGNNKAGTVARSTWKHNQQQLTKRQRRNNFELLLAEADGHSTGCSSLAPNDDDDGGGGEDDVVVEDDDENEEECRSELSNRLVRDEAGYLIEATSQAAPAKTSPTKGAFITAEQRSNFHELSLSAKNKLLLGEYLYA